MNINEQKVIIFIFQSLWRTQIFSLSHPLEKLTQTELKQFPISLYIYIYIYHESITNKALFSSTYNNIPDQIISFGEFYGFLHHFDHGAVSLHNPSSTLRICCTKLNCVSVFSVAFQILKKGWGGVVLFKR